MTLKEKFENNITGVVGQVYITDDFAIGFAEWILSIGVYHQLIRTQKINKELLEIYKQEKAL